MRNGVSVSRFGSAALTLKLGSLHNAILSPRPLALAGVHLEHANTLKRRPLLPAIFDVKMLKLRVITFFREDLQCILEREEDVLSSNSALIHPSTAMHIEDHFTSAPTTLMINSKVN